MEEDDDDGFHVLLQQGIYCGANLALDQSCNDAPFGIHSLRHLDAKIARHDWFKNARQAVKLRSGSTPEFERISESARRNQSAPRTAPLKDGVCCDCRSMHDCLNGRNIVDQTRQAVHEAFRLICRRAGDLDGVEPAPLRIKRDQVSEGSANVDADCEQ
jgi:hypothetical protein